MRYLLDLDKSGMALRFELAMLMSGWMQLYQSMSPWSLTSLELDVRGPEEETTLGELLGGAILWDKKHIVFTGSAPTRPPSPPSPHNSPPLSPPLDDDRDNYKSLSPP
jgi:hypothetical protein